VPAAALHIPRIEITGNLRILPSASAEKIMGSNNAVYGLYQSEEPL
jgi:hypothetical protein